MFKLIGCFIVFVLLFIFFLLVLFLMFKKIGLNLKFVDVFVEEDSIFVVLECYEDLELKVEVVGLVDLFFIKNVYFGEINE